jgi:dTDP-D-glucose 4,6-dehydratase
VNELNWKPKLNFEETLKMTTDGYLVDLKIESNVYAARIEQIKKYCSL